MGYTNMKFSELNLKPAILKGLADKGYAELTEIQEKTFEYVLSGRDMIARAETGSGKTAACAIPVAQNTDPSINHVQALILVPTRELALQYVSEIAEIAKHTDIAAFAVYGGFSIEIQKSKLDHGVHILVATPGRLIDLLYNSPLRLSEVSTFVLDEADEMLDMGFIGDVEFVMSCLIHEHQTLLFSATMPQQIKKLTDKYLRDPATVELNVSKVAPENLEHCFMPTTRNGKMEDLVGFLEQKKPRQVIIFCNSRRNVESCYKQLRDKVKDVDMIHGGLEQNKRTSLFRRFRRGDIKVMIATDVAGRGLDFSHVTYVINYDFPNNAETYTHRTGRTARMGRKGTAVTFYSRGDLRSIKEVVECNHVKPVWLGDEPDLSKVPKGRGPARRGGYGGSSGTGGYRPGNKKGRPRTGRKA